MDPSPELIRALGGLEASVTNLSKGFDDLKIDLKDDLKDIIETCHSYKDYKESRKNLPDRINKLEIIAEEFIQGKESRERESELIKFLSKRHDMAMTAAAVLNMMALVFIWLLSKGYLRLDIS